MNLSIKYFEILSNNIRQIIKGQDRINQTQLLADKLKHYVQIMVEADKAKIQQIYDYFCQANDMDVFRKILQFDKLTVVRTLSLLLINVKNQLWVSYILSHPIMPQLISIQVQQEGDQLAQYYISFLKSLSIRLNADQVSLFYNKKFAKFPLVYQAIKYYNHSDNMVRTSVMNLVLGIMKIKNPKVVQYFCTFPFTTYFIHFCCLLNDQWVKLDSMLNSQITKHKLKMEISDQNDSLYFLFDIYQYGSQQIIFNLKNTIISYNILPILMGSLISGKQGPISKKLSLYLLLLFLKIFKDSEIQQIISICLFGKKIDSSLLKKISSDVYIPKSYCKQYKANYFWDKFDYEMSDHCQKIFDDVNNFETDHEIDKKNGIISQNSKQFIQQIENISKFVGFGLLSQNHNITSEISLKKYLDFRNINNQYQQNPIRKTIIQLLSQKDDSLVWIITNIIITIQKKQLIPNNVLVFCGLLMPRLDTVNYLDQFNIKSILQIKQILLKQLDIQPLYRIATIKNIAILLDSLIFRDLQENEFRLLSHTYEKAILELKKSIKIENIINLVRIFQDEYKKWTTQSFYYEITIPFTAFLNAVESYPQIKQQQHLPINQKQLIKRNIIYFTIIKQIMDNYLILFKKQSPTIFQQKFSEIFNKTLHKWKPQKSYFVQNMQMMECKIGTIYNYALHPQSNINHNVKLKKIALIVQDDYNFLLMEPSQQNIKCTILLNIKYKYFEMEICKDDAKNALVRWSQQPKGQILIGFGNDLQCYSIMQKLKQKAKRCFEEEYAFILKFLNSCLKDINYQPK